MQRMFRSATLKLTAWYLLIFMAISVIFSAVIYQLNYREVSFRLENLQQSLIERSAPDEQAYLTALFASNDSPMRYELRQAAGQMTLSLVYLNVILLATSGAGAYFLARRTLRPIEAAHEAQSRFTSDASHELRTPLAAMKAELEVALLNSQRTEAETEELLASTLEEVDKLIRLSELLLKLSRFEHDSLEHTTTTLALAVRSTVKSLNKSAQKRIVVQAKKQGQVIANEAALAELAAILIENALKYSPKGSPVTVRVQERRGLATLLVHNTGTPIPAEALPRLFDRFFRADVSRTKSNENGYGLGLSIAKKISDIHHAELSVKSTAAAGTTFRFSLPVYRRNTRVPSKKTKAL